MIPNKALFTWIISISLLAFIVLISACRTSTDPDPEPEPGPTPIDQAGVKELTFTIINRDSEDELTGYDIEIDGPVSASESNVSSAQFTLSDVVSGEYTITVSLNGFASTGVTQTLDVPEEVTANYIVGRTISLRELTPPVKVDNTKDTTVQTGKPDEEDATEEESVSFEIPANSFPDDVVNEDGTVDISVTRARPSQVAHNDEGLVREFLIITPAAELNNPIIITIPIREIEGLEDLEYTLQPGNIPLVRDGGGNLVATINPVVPSSVGFGPTSDQAVPSWVTLEWISDSVTRFPRRDDMPEIHSLNEERDTINRLQLDISGFQVTTPSLRITEGDKVETVFETISGECGGSLPAYELEGKKIPPEIGTFLDRAVIDDYEETRSVSFPQYAPITGRVLSLEVRHKTKTYIAMRGSIEEARVTVNLDETETQNAMNNPCVVHDSGGQD